MKKAIIIFMISISATNILCAQTDIIKREIPLNSINGMFLKLEHKEQELFFNGFDVDKNENIYLSYLDTAKQNKLAVFDKSNKPKQQKTLKFNNSWMYFYNGDFVFIENNFKNSILHYKQNSMKINAKSTLGYYYSENEHQLIIETYCDSKKEHQYPIYSLPELKDLGFAPNKYNLPDSMYNKYVKNGNMEYKGMIDKGYVFCELKLSGNMDLSYEIIIIDAKGKLISTQYVKENDLYPNNICTRMGCNVEVLRILRDNKLYFFGADKKKNCVVIAEIKLD